MRAICLRLRILRRTSCALALLAATACDRSHTPAPPVVPGQGPSAHIEWLLGPHALLNAVDLTGPSAGAAVGELGEIIVTTDGGVTWTSVESGTDRSLRGVAFADATNGVAVGAGGTVLRTADGGHSWTMIGIGSAAELRAVAFSGPAVGVIVGEDGVVFRTTDGGGAWQQVASGTSSTLRAVRFASPAVAVAVGDDGTLVRSTDGGLTWAPLESKTRAALRGLHFVTATTGVAVGGDDRRWRAERVVLRTTDGGATWAKTGVPEGDRLYGVTATSDGSIVAVGEAGGSIRSSDQGLTWQAADPVRGTAEPGSPAAASETSNWFASVTPAGQALVAVTYGGRIFRSADAGAKWNRARQTPDMGTIGKSAVAWAGGDALVIGAGNFIFRSAGGGTFKKSEAAGKQPVHDIEFLDPLVGVAVGAGGTIQRTVDGGKTWTPVESRTKLNLTDAAFGDRIHGIAVAGRRPGIVRTEDGGLTWRTQSCDICEVRGGLAAVDMASSQIAIAVGSSGAVFKTTDGGRNWTKLHHGLMWDLLWSVALVDANTAVAVGQQGVILHTGDGGATWTRRESGTPLLLRGVAFADESHGIIVGSAGTMLTTSDGGLTWRREMAGTTRDLTGVIFDTSGDAIITGSHGLLLRYTWPAIAQEPASDTVRRLP
ncbi:MAG TPA: YCF48-related protein [Gemmatimonadaceae bacterium]|nr:YCF48-related protein [Gemmatimonadaceae bacterium]